VRNDREGDLEQAVDDDRLFVTEYTRAVSFISNHLLPGQVSVTPFPSESRSEDGGRERCTTAAAAGQRGLCFVLEQAAITKVHHQ
jgi:hypothetical protein